MGAEPASVPTTLTLAAELAALRETLLGLPLRGLGEADLLTRGEIRAALRCSWAAVDDLLSRIPSVQVGRIQLWRWGRVLRHIEGEPVQICDTPAALGKERRRDNA